MWRSRICALSPRGPLAGEGSSEVQRGMRGEGGAKPRILSKRPPHPFYIAATSSCPPPRGGRANAAPTHKGINYVLFHGRRLRTSHLPRAARQAAPCSQDS